MTRNSAEQNFDTEIKRLNTDAIALMYENSLKYMSQNTEKYEKAIIDAINKQVELIDSELAGDDAKEINDEANIETLFESKFFTGKIRVYLVIATTVDKSKYNPEHTDYDSGYDSDTDNVEVVHATSKLVNLEKIIDGVYKKMSKLYDSPFKLTKRRNKAGNTFSLYFTCHFYEE